MLTSNPYFLRDGFITNAYGERCFADSPRFDDAIDADYWLAFISPEGAFGGAYIADDRADTCNERSEDGGVTVPGCAESRSSRCDATVAALRRAGTAITLNNWLRWNGIDPADTPDAVLLEIIPEQFRELYERRFDATEGR